MYHASFRPSTGALNPRRGGAARYSARFSSAIANLSSASASESGGGGLRVGDLVEGIERALGVPGIGHLRDRGAHLGEPRGENMIGELSHPLEDARLFLVREVRLLGTEHDAHLELGRQSQSYARVHDEIFARPFGQHDLLISRAEDFETSLDQRLLYARSVVGEGLRHRWGARLSNSEAKPQAHLLTSRPSLARQSLCGSVAFGGHCGRGCALLRAGHRPCVVEACEAMPQRFC